VTAHEPLTFVVVAVLVVVAALDACCFQDRLSPSNGEGVKKSKEK
jgi:hypothetical protein